MTHAIVVFSAALLAGALNSVAGGGSFISFPALLFVGVPAIAANTTNTAALWPGIVASIGAYRRDFSTPIAVMLWLGGISLVGGLVGALFLLHTPEAAFQRLIPYLLASATILFAFSDRIALLFPPPGKRLPGGARSIALVCGLQFFISAYGGYFGGGIGILMLAALGVLGMENIHAMNALKALLSAVINGVAVVAFVLAHNIVWPYALIMAVGATAGGYFGAFFARKLEPTLVRRFVIVVGATMSIYFFYRQWT
ncbi:MAG: sulfite exporter TauE/SafE family protein [Candidatus Eremiobacteraeota bacterium]|nr:sulfite exporter TauE/SafE family protein [Candidatus Eremiobacteraeota bacterium]MBC5826702.1 sulfite exporter TauE/SafE family protein [Candidatus Eremiobacteraeota bacterium]